MEWWPVGSIYRQDKVIFSVSFMVGSIYCSSPLNSQYGRIWQ
jgi:hypothetical protein